MVANIMSAFFPAFMFSREPDPAALSRDPKVGEAFTADPLVSSSTSARWFTEFTRAQNEARGLAHELVMPALVMQSGADTLVDPEATREWAANAPAPLVEYVEWKGFRHEMFNEIEKERVFAKMEGWLDQQLQTSAPKPDVD
jgi:lysophospholipase